jgi:hypothetical protein
MHRFAIFFGGAFVAAIVGLPSHVLVAAPEIPGESTKQPIAIVGATVHSVASEPIA